MEEKQKKRLLWQLPFLTLLVIGTILIIRHQQKMPYQKSADFIFGFEPEHQERTNEGGSLFVAF